MFIFSSDDERSASLWTVDTGPDPVPETYERCSCVGPPFPELSTLRCCSQTSCDWVLSGVRSRASFPSYRWCPCSPWWLWICCFRCWGSTDIFLVATPPLPQFCWRCGREYRLSPVLPSWNCHSLLPVTLSWWFWWWLAIHLRKYHLPSLSRCCSLLLLTPPNRTCHYLRLVLLRSPHLRCRSWSCSPCPHSSSLAFTGTLTRCCAPIVVDLVSSQDVSRLREVGLVVAEVVVYVFWPLLPLADAFS